MKILGRSILPLLASCSAAFAASAWTFEDATLTIAGKGAGVGAGVKETLSPTTPLVSKAISLGGADTLKIALTALEGKTGKRPHQAFLTLHEQSSGLEESFAFSVKENGKAKLDVAQKDIPFQFLTSSQPIKASIILASFGSSTPFDHHVFDLNIAADDSSAPFIPTPPERYTAKPQIHHIFKAGPKSPIKILSLVFTLAILAAVPALFGTWTYLGGNINDVGKAFGTNPVAHGLFLGSIVAMEGVFFMYYVSWNLFQTLPVAAVVGVVAFVSGSRALTEVQERRLAGE